MLYENSFRTLKINRNYCVKIASYDVFIKMTEGNIMPQVKLGVKLLAYTPEPLAVIYAAFRQCYHDGFVGDMWEKLQNGEISREQQGEFVSKIISSGHESPVEHVSFTFAISGVSRALTHQLVRHRIASYSQQSQRYVDASHFDFILPPAIAKNPKILERYENFMLEVAATYTDIKSMLEDDGRENLAKEDARMVLPQACASNIVISMNCRSLINFFEHRCCTRAQWEIRACANEMLGQCQNTLPEIFRHAGAKCERLGYCPEGEKFCCGRYTWK